MQHRRTQREATSRHESHDLYEGKVKGQRLFLSVHFERSRHRWRTVEGYFFFFFFNKPKVPLMYTLESSPCRNKCSSWSQRMVRMRQTGPQLGSRADYISNPIGGLQIREDSVIVDRMTCWGSLHAQSWSMIWDLSQLITINHGWPQIPDTERNFHSHWKSHWPHKVFTHSSEWCPASGKCHLSACMRWMRFKWRACNVSFSLWMWDLIVDRSHQFSYGITC